MKWLDHHMREVLRGASWALALRVLGAAASFGINVQVARMLGAEGVGIYTLGITALTVATVVSRLGLDNAMIRFIAASASNEDWRAAASTHRSGLVLCIAVSLPVAALLFFSRSVLAVKVFQEPGLVAAIGAAAVGVPVLSLLALQAESLRAVRAVARSVFVRYFGVSAVLLFALAVMPAERIFPATVVKLHVGSALVMLLLATLWIRQAAPSMSRHKGEIQSKALLRTSLPMLLVSSMSFLMAWTDTVMLGVLRDSTGVGLYGAANKTAALGSLTLVAVNAVAAPIFSSLYAAQRLDELERIARKNAVLMLCVSTPVILTCLFLPTLVLRIFGQEFQSAGTALAILTVGQLINLATGSVGLVLQMTGYEKILRNNIVLAALLNIILNAALVPRFGVNGAAGATAFSLTTLNVLSVVGVRRSLGIVAVPFLRKGANLA